MKQVLRLLLLVVATALVEDFTSLAVAQSRVPVLQPPLPAYYTYGQLKSVTTAEALQGSAAATTIPMWRYNVTASTDRGGGGFTGVMVGRSAFAHGAKTTDITAEIIPVDIIMQDTSTAFDPSVADSTCLSSMVPLTVFQNSPLFNATDFVMNGIDMGVGQYVDDFQRANFFTENVEPTGTRYHTRLNPVTTLAEQTLSVPASEGGTFMLLGGCGFFGIIDFATFDSFVQNTVIPFVSAHGGGPTTLPIILLYNVVLATPFVPGTAEHCCVLGYHNAFSNPVQTYSVGDFDSTGGFPGISDISAPSHEIAEWMDDPLGTNSTPAWGHVGQVNGCQNNLEVGDPLSGTLFPSVMLNGFTYHPQELAFFSWFFATPSIGAAGDFSNNGTFTTDAGAVCK